MARELARINLGDLIFPASARRGIGYGSEGSRCPKKMLLSPIRGIRRTLSGRAERRQTASGSRMEPRGLGRTDRENGV